MDRIRCSGCSRAERDSLTPDAGLYREEIARLEHRVSDLRWFIDEAQTWEDLAALNEFWEEQTAWLEIYILVIECTSTALDRQRYFQRILRLQSQLPGAQELCVYMQHGFSASLCLRFQNLDFYEVSTISTKEPIRHVVWFNDPTNLAEHWEILTSLNHSRWPLFVLTDLPPSYIIFLGQVLDVDPRVFISHMWRGFQRNASKFRLSLVEKSSARVSLTTPGFEPFKYRIPQDLDESFEDGDGKATQPSFSKLTYTSCIEGLGQLDWISPNYKFIHGRIDSGVQQIIENLGGRCVSSPLRWVEVDGLEISVPVQSVAAHATVDFVTTTSVHCLEGSTVGSACFGR